MASGLLGLVRQGSIPWMIVGLIAFSSVVVFRPLSLLLTEMLKQERRNTMRQTTRLKKLALRFIKLFGLSLVNSIWAIETNIVAGALPA